MPARSISRRDFLNGTALTIGAIGAGPLFMSTGQAMGNLAGSAPGAANTLPGPLPADYYPPTRTGMRGSHFLQDARAAELSAVIIGFIPYTDTRPIEVSSRESCTARASASNQPQSSR